MNVSLILVKVKARLNKVDSSDYDNIETPFIIEAFNKAQRDWCRRQLYGANQYKESSEQTKHKVSDLQLLLTSVSLPGTNLGNVPYFESNTVPSDLLKFEKVSAKAKTKQCTKGKVMVVKFIEEANSDVWLQDWALKPSFEWGTTFNTILSNKVRVYHGNDFEVVSPITFTYYRQPKDISVDGIEDIDGVQHGNINPEFSDDIVELLIDETVSILSGDIESFNVHSITEKRKEYNN